MFSSHFRTSLAKNFALPGSKRMLIVSTLKMSCTKSMRRAFTSASVARRLHHGEGSSFLPSRIPLHFSLRCFFRRTVYLPGSTTTRLSIDIHRSVETSHALCATRAEQIELSVNERFLFLLPLSNLLPSTLAFSYPVCQHPTRGEVSTVWTSAPRRRRATAVVA